MRLSVRTLALVAGATLASVSTVARADDGGLTQGDFLVRARALGVLPDVSNDSIKVNSAPITGSVDATKTAIPEVDFTYFFTSMISAELIAGTTQHSVTTSNPAAPALGNVRLLPPTLTAQFHPLPEARFNPYVGVGLNYSYFYDQKGASDVKSSFHLSDAWGAALQVGFDYRVEGNWFANFDVKKIFVTSEAKASDGAIVSNVSIDPWLVGAGVGYRF